MTGTSGKNMGRVTIEFEVANNNDLALVDAGHLAPDQVRKFKLQGIVDTGAARLVIPEFVGKQLGLPLSGQSTVRFADSRTAQRDVVSDAFIQILGRSGVFHAVLEPSRTDALLGAIVMEDLDLVVDCSARKVHPRDPNYLITEIG